MTRAKYLRARDYALACARRAKTRAILCDREGRPDWADFSREQVRMYVRDARYFNRQAVRS